MPDSLDLSTLLRDAAGEPAQLDLVEVRQRVVKRRRRRHSLIGALATVAVAIGLAAATNLKNTSQESRITTVPDTIGEGTPELLERLPLDAKNVASAPDGSVWALAPAETGGFAVHEVDAVSGRSVRSIELPGSATFLEFGLGHLWIGVGGDGAEPDGHLWVIEPTTGTIIADERIDGGGPNDFAFSDDAAWVTTGAAGDVWKLAFDRGPLQKESLHLGGQTDNIVVLDNGDVWTRDYIGGRIVRIDPERVVLAQEIAWAGAPLAPSGQSRVWALDPDGRVVEVDLGRIEGDHPTVVQTVPTEMRYPSVVATNTHLWVHRDGVERWSIPVASGAKPATTDARDVYFLRDLDGTAWFVSGGGGGGLWRWRPASVPTATGAPSGVRAVDPAPSREGKLVVFVENDASAEDLAAIRAKLEAHPATVRVVYLDHDAAHREFAEMFKDQPSLVARTTAEELPRSFHVVPTSESSAPAIARSLAGLTGVKEVICPNSGRCQP
jgi:streptogramin lyase